MDIFLSYSEIPQSKTPIILTIGNFDAVHLGHSTVLHRAREIADELEGTLCVLTFSSHSSRVLHPESSPLLLCTETHKLKLLQEQKVNGVILLEFTLAFSRQTAAQFLSSLYEMQPFSALILGYDARIGSDRQGNTLLMQQLASELSFKLEYLPPYIYEGLTVSSSAIRRAVSSGDLKLAEKMLGRKFSIFSIAIGTIEKSSFEIDVKALCLPPAGTYPVKICHDGKTSLGQGFVGLDSLTVELSSEGQSLNERVIEVLFD